MTARSCYQPVWFSASHSAILGVELFAVTGMLRNGIAVYGNRVFLCTGLWLVFFFLLLMMYLMRKEGRLDLFAPNLEDNLDGSLHQQHE